MCPKMEPETMKIEVGRGSGRSWKRSWHENCLGGCLGRLWPILDRRGEAKMAARWPNLAPRWGQDGPRWGLSGHLVADWGVILGILGRLGGDLCRNGRSVKMSVTMAFWPQIGGLGGLVGGSWGYLGASWRQVGLSWAILASRWDLLGSMLGQRWRR